ncbi:adenylosuccinate lyase [Candidatus Woesearchaeota archaeon]|nr:adenylosuccinate lyase [Candidatus Woesearchaeota archaeon]
MDSRFDNISPIDYRYSPDGPEKELLSEKARIVYQLKVEAALAAGLARYNICPPQAAEEIIKACRKISPDEVYKEEEKTKHDIRALANCIRRNVSDKAKPFVHFTATSEDIKLTSESLRYKDITQQFIIPQLKELEKSLIEKALLYKGTVQTGRTHGQHGVPITFGFALSEYVSRLGARIEKIAGSASELRGQMSGAVGAYNASSLFIKDTEKFESELVESLGLKRSQHSTQIIEPEYLTDFMHSIISCFGVIANLADDIRHLQRTEIAEVAERFEAGQVGSSTMPHKRNPWHFENIKSLYKEIMPRMITIYLDQTSEHQRDLTNSASARWIPEILSVFMFAVKRMTKHLTNLMVVDKNMLRNLELSKEMVVAEPLYILLAYHGHPDAHEYVRKMTLKSQKTGRNLRELAMDDKDIKRYLERFSGAQMDVIRHPERYTGRSENKCMQTCRYWKKRLEL